MHNIHNWDLFKRFLFLHVPKNKRGIKSPRSANFFILVLFIFYEKWFYAIADVDMFLFQSGDTFEIFRLLIFMWVHSNVSFVITAKYLVELGVIFNLTDIIIMGLLCLFGDQFDKNVWFADVKLISILFTADKNIVLRVTCRIRKFRVQSFVANKLNWWLRSEIPKPEGTILWGC